MAIFKITVAMDSKNIKDYLHLYLGCECVNEDGKRGRFAGLDVCEKDYGIVMLTMRFDSGNIEDDEDWNVYNDNNECDRIKLVLRTLSDITEEEYHIEFPKNNRGEFIDMHWYPEGYMWLLSKGFDLFGLIDAGLAIKKSS